MTIYIKNTNIGQTDKKILYENNSLRDICEQCRYVGKEVIVHVYDDPLTGVITQHKAHMVEVKWIHCNPLREENEPPKTLWYGHAERIHDPRATSSFWSLGSMCIFEGKEFVIAGVRSMVKVKWQEGFVEEISNTKLVESGEFFSGQFVAKKEGEGVGFVRFVVDGIENQRLL